MIDTRDAARDDTEAWDLQIVFDLVYTLETSIAIVAYKGQSYTNTAAQEST